MSDKNIYKLFKELDNCDKRCLKQLLLKDEEKNNKEEGDKKIKELIEWLEKDGYSADSMSPIIYTLDKKFDNTTVDFLFLTEMEVEKVRKTPTDEYVLIQVQSENGVEIYDLRSFFEKELQKRRFLKDNNEIDRMIASTKAAYEEYYGCE